MKTIDLENHFVTELYYETLRTNKGTPRVEPGKGLVYWEDSWLPIASTTTGAQAKLLDMGEGRIKEMDEDGVDFAYLSLTAPGAEAFEPATGAKIARDANDRLAEYISKYPNRLGGMATLAPKDVDEAVKELERCVKELGFKGWHTHSNYHDSYIDEKRYWPILAKAEELDIPIYLHPACPMIPDIRTFGICLSGPTFGFGTEVMFVFLRMIHRGVFDAFPKLKIILGHFGEAFPFLLDRVDTAYRQGYEKPYPEEIGPGTKELASYYVKNNLWVTSSGNYLPAAYYCTRDALGVDKILLATDHPYEKMKWGVDYLNELNLSDEERKAICRENAMGLGFTL